MALPLLSTNLAVCDRGLFPKMVLCDKEIYLKYDLGWVIQTEDVGQRMIVTLFSIALLI